VSTLSDFERKMLQRAVDHLEHVAISLERQGRVIGQVTSLQEQYPAQALDSVRHALDLARSRVLSALEQVNLALQSGARAPGA
jgi:hypothetical protein